METLAAPDHLSSNPWASDARALERAADLRVSIVGSTLPACLLAMGLGGMGIRRLAIAGGDLLPDGLGRLARTGDAGAGIQSLVEAVTEGRVNPGMVSIPVDERSLALVPPSDIIVEASGTFLLRAAFARRVQQTGEDLLLLSAARGRSRVRALAGGGAVRAADVIGEMRGWSNGPEDPAAALLAAGIALEAVRQKVAPIPGEEQIADVSVGVAPLPATAVRAAVVGAGGLGTWVLLAAGLAARPPFGSVTVFDDDMAEVSNLNRQVLYFRRTGFPKADTLVERMAVVAPAIRWQSRVERVTASSRRSLAGHGVWLGLPDNGPTRVLLSDMAASLGRPLVSAASGPESADARLYVPGCSSCEACEKGLRSLNEEMPADPCSARREPSVVGINMIGAALLWDVLARFVSGDPCWRAPARYTRGRVIRESIPDPCACHARARLLGPEWRTP